MRWWSFLTILFLTLNQAQAVPDILVDSRLDYDFSTVLVKKLRTLLINHNLKDPFTGSFPGPMIVNESEINEYLPDDSKELIETFGNSVGLNILKTKTQVTLHDLKYDVKGFKTNLNSGESTTDGLTMGLNLSASEVSLEAGKVSLSLVIPGKTSSPVLNIDIIRPVLKAQGDNLIGFNTTVKLQNSAGSYKIKVLNASFEKMANSLMEDPELVVLDYEQLVIPEVSLKIGNKTITFSPEKITSLIREKHEAIKGIILAQATKALNAGATNSLLPLLDKVTIDKEYWLLTDKIRTQIMLGKFSATKGTNNIEISMGGDFCTLENFDKFQTDCGQNKITKSADSRLTASQHKQSVELMKDLMNRGEADIVASVSEDYINKLIVTTLDAGLWKEALDAAQVALGPNKVILKLNKKGDTGTVIMDVIYKPSKLERLFTGSREIRFPLVLDMTLRVDVRDEIPFIVIHLRDVDTSDETLINGRPEDNVISTVRNVPRFKKKVAKAIREKVGVLRGTDIIQLPYPQYKGIGLEHAEFFSDGMGRMNAYLRLEDLI